MLVAGVPVLQRDEVERVVGRRDQAQQTEARDARVVLDARLRLEDRVELVVDRGGAVEGGGERKLDVGEDVALVLFLDENTRETKADDARHRGGGEQQEYREGGLADQEATAVHVPAH